MYIFINILAVIFLDSVGLVYFYHKVITQTGDWIHSISRVFVCAIVSMVDSLAFIVGSKSDDAKLHSIACATDFACLKKDLEAERADLAAWTHFFL